MRIHGKGGDAKGLGNDDLGGFMPHTRKLLQGLQIGRDLTTVFPHEDLGKLLDGFGLLRAEAARLDDPFDFLHRNLGNDLRGAPQSPQFGGDLVDPHVCALCGKKDGDQESVRIGMIQRDWRLGVKLLQALEHMGGAFCLRHVGGFLAALKTLHHFTHVIVFLAVFHDRQTL